MYHRRRIINLLLAARGPAYWHDNIQMKLFLCSSISQQQCHGAHFCHSPCASEPEISVGWFLGKRLKRFSLWLEIRKTKAADATVNGTPGCEMMVGWNHPLEMTQRCRLSPSKRTFITAKRKQTQSIWKLWIICERAGARPDIYGGEMPERLVHVCTDGGRPRSTFK